MCAQGDQFAVKLPTVHVQTWQERAVQSIIPAVTSY
jgi:hypothetical protein